ncbi:MAG: SDR family oxidoreductase [Prevotellaceae bacterium]|nr:SDR family oxidoreductase [Prevotellaceae bacterium]
MTGGTKGIGVAVAEKLAAEGCDLILTYSNDTENAELAAKTLREKFAVNVNIVQADISDENSIALINNYLTEQNILLDALIFNAGLTLRSPFEETELAEWEKVFFANVHFPVFLLQRIINKINKGGCVIFTGSMMGVEPHSVSLAYGVTKSAIHALVKNLVKFLVPYEIRVNAVAPGFVDTEWQKSKPQEIRRNIENKIALKRFCEPQEIAEVYKMLINNIYFNGEIVTVSGGYCFN